MKIAIVARPYHALPTPDDSTWAPGIVMAAEAKALSDAGHEITVYSAKDSKVVGEVVDFDMPSINRHKSDLPLAQHTIRNSYYFNLFIERVITHLRQNPVDIIHLHDYRDLPIFKAANLNIPVVTTVHGDYEYNFENSLPGVYESLGEANLIALSKPTHLPEGMVDPLAVVPNPFDAERFKLVEDPTNRFVYVGRLTHGKGVDSLLEIIRQTNLPIDIYGDSFESPELKDEFMAEIAKHPNVSYKGHVPHSEVEQCFDAKALLFPITKPEGFPLVVLESLSCGTPVLTFDIGGMADIVEDGRTGRVIEPGNVKAMISAMESIDELSREHCRAAVLERFNPDNYATSLINVFEKVIQKR